MNARNLMCSTISALLATASQSLLAVNCGRPRPYLVRCESEGVETNVTCQGAFQLKGIKQGLPVVRYVCHSLEQCFSNLFARGPLLASKNNPGPSHPWSRKYGESG
jgi:hypothetical protein